MSRVTHVKDCEGYNWAFYDGFWCSICFKEKYSSLFELHVKYGSLSQTVRDLADIERIDNENRES